MNLKQILLSLVLVDFAAFTAWVLYAYGPIGALELAFANGATIQITIDLCIALAAASVWMYRDARRLGLSPIPWVVGTLGTGTLGLMAYLVRREWALKGVPSASEALAAAK